MQIVLEHIAAPTDEARALIGELDAELNGAYAPEQRHGLNIDAIFQPNIAFFIARLDGKAVGCGGIAFEDGFAELKRMYVRPAARRKGVARGILLRLQAEARGRGMARLVLETGDAQQSAMTLYEREGFTRCKAFGEYAAMSATAIERSVFFEKRIA
jgi:putative acetyltransferase